MVVDTRTVLSLSGASAMDLKNWRRRGSGLAAGEPGRVAEWSLDQVLHVCFMKALLDSGVSALEASTEAQAWLKERKKAPAKWAPFYARNLETGLSIGYSNPEMTTFDLASSLADDAPAGYAGESRVEAALPATRLAIIDRGELVRRVEQAFRERD